MASIPQPMILPLTLAVGVIIGSFLNVLIYRLPRKRSIVFPGSQCPGCETAISWYDNVPLLSWLLLRARCRHCKTPISVRYPLIEAAAGLAALGAIARHGLTVTGAEVTIFAWMTIVLGMIDLEHQLLPDVLTYPAIVLGLGASYLGGLATLFGSVFGAALGAAIPIGVIFTYRLIRGEDGMGWGDVKYLAAIGAVVGVRGCLGVLVAAAVVGAVVGLLMIAWGKGSGKTALPFGTFLAIAVLVWLYIPQAWHEALLRTWLPVQHW